MKSLMKASLIAASLFSSAAFAGHGTHWGYEGHTSPEHWGDLSPAYETCGKGKNQSPIDLSGMIESKLAPLKFNYATGGDEVLNNGHSVQVNYKPGSSFEIEGRTFELKQFHFHSPSENTIEGESFPMEAHFVHADKDGNLAVIAVMFREGKENKELAKAWKKMPTEGQHKALASLMNADELMPNNREYYRFNGSLTTPPCSENVVWVVMKDIQTASAKQIEQFAHMMHHDNNRPVQPVNARVVLK